MVLLPLDFWEKIQDKLENLEMHASKTFRTTIARARKEEKIYSAKEVRRTLGL